MKKIKIITDSSSDLNKELLDMYDIDYAKMSTIRNGVESPAILTWSYDEAHAFYDVIRSGERVTTAQVTAAEFTEVFTKYLDQGMDIIYIACPLRLSGTVNTGKMVAQKLQEQYPESKILCLDSLNGTIGLGMLAIMAAEMARDGVEAEKIVEEIAAVRNNVVEYATINSLDTLKRSGRVSASKAFFGNLFGVKPIMICDTTGIQAAIGKVKGRKAAIRRCLELFKENVIEPENQIIYLWHSDCDEEEVREVEAMLRAEIPCKDVRVGLIGPIVGAAAGPSIIGFWGYGKEVTYHNED